jgi:prenyltransferase beta subunit
MENILSPAVAEAAAATLSKAVAYVESMQEANGAWSRLKGEFPAESEPTSWAVKVLKRIAGEEERVARGAAFILGDQKPDGSWNNNSAHTAFALLALLEAGIGAGAIGKAAAYLQSVQEPGGGFTRIGREGQPLTVYTANVLFAADAAGFGKGATWIDRALLWLVSCQNRDGGFGMMKGSESITLATTWTMRALRAIDPESPEPAEALEWLLKMQHTSGGFSMTGAAPEDPEVTSLAMCALRGFAGTQEAVERALGYLNGVQHPDGAFTSSMPMQFNNVAKKNTQSTLFVAWALEEVVQGEVQ